MPYFGGVVGTVGGLTDALQCFVLPPIIYRAVMKDSLHPLWNIFYNTVCAWGCITIAYTLIKLMFGLISLTHGDHSGMVS